MPWELSSPHWRFQFCSLYGLYRALHKLDFVVCRCLRSMEPVLLVGETGTGKTTVCQMAALMRGQRLHILNCNQHTETSDFLGGFRPARQVSCILCAALPASSWYECAAASMLHSSSFVHNHARVAGFQVGMRC